MRLGVMCSGNGSNFENIVRSCREDEVVVMIHNKEKCGAAKRADKLGIPHTHIKSKNEDLIIDVMNAWKVELIVLAGWMRIISPRLLNEFPDRIINIHPSLLPKYKGLDVVEQALNNGDSEAGCTVHYVTTKLDSGKIILQKKVKIKKRETVNSLKKKVLKKEHQLYPSAIRKIFS